MQEDGAGGRDARQLQLRGPSGDAAVRARSPHRAPPTAPASEGGRGPGSPVGPLDHPGGGGRGAGRGAGHQKAGGGGSGGRAERGGRGGRAPGGVGNAGGVPGAVAPAPPRDPAQVGGAGGAHAGEQDAARADPRGHALTSDANNAIYQAIRDYKARHPPTPPLPPCPLPTHPMPPRLTGGGGAIAHTYSVYSYSDGGASAGEGAAEADGGAPRRPEHHGDAGPQEARGRREQVGRDGVALVRQQRALRGHQRRRRPEDTPLGGGPPAEPGRVRRLHFAPGRRPGVVHHARDEPPRHGGRGDRGLPLPLLWRRRRQRHAHRQAHVLPHVHGGVREAR